VFTSTNKVYGDLADLSLRRRELRWEPDDPAIRRHGIGEDRPLAFCSPYGCSKGAADQYALEFGRSYGLPAVVLRMSCIYGPHQYGTEDQGWLAHFLINALNGRPLTLYGDGAQVRDVLYVDDLVDALLLAEAHAPDLGPSAFNIGGGPENVLSLLELLERMEDAGLAPPRLEHAGWRLADQRYYVSDFRRFAEATGWAPRTGLDDGIDALLDWLVSAGPARALSATQRPAVPLARRSGGIR
jgi:CDP-paratose 2-epimerase